MTATTETATITAHLPLVRYLVARTPGSINRAALISAGNLALLLGVRSYDPHRGTPLRTWLAMCIRRGLADEGRHDDWLGRCTRTAVTAQGAATLVLTARLGRDPTVAELAAATGQSTIRVRGLQAAAQGRPVGLSEAVTDRAATDPAQDPGAVLVAREQVGRLREAVAALPDRMRAVVDGCDFDGRSRASLGVELGVSASQVSHLHTRALVWMRDAMGDTVSHNKSHTGVVVSDAHAAYLVRCAVPHSLASRLAHTTIHGDVITRARLDGYGESGVVATGGGGAA